jgi:hypothetical protein
MMRDKYLNYIAGEWVDGPDVAQNINPSDISEVIADYVRADRPQTIEAINAASNAAESWRNFGVQISWTQSVISCLIKKSLLALFYLGKRAKHYLKVLERSLELGIFSNSLRERCSGKLAIYYRR